MLNGDPAKVWDTESTRVTPLQDTFRTSKCTCITQILEDLKNNLFIILQKKI